MLKKKLRLNLSLEFKKVASGKRIHSTHFSLFLLRELHVPARVGIALAKKEFRHSHERNRARRLMSEVVSKNYNRLSNGLQLIIMPKAGILNASINDLTDEFNSITDLYKAD